MSKGYRTMKGFVNHLYSDDKASADKLLKELEDLSIASYLASQRLIAKLTHGQVARKMKLKAEDIKRIENSKNNKIKAIELFNYLNALKLIDGRYKV